MRLNLAVSVFIVFFLTVSPAGAQDSGDPQPASAGQSADTGADEDLTPSLAEPDFTVVNLPTTLRLPKHKAAFRITHRFQRPLGDGDFGDLLSNFFNLDSSAQIGLEFRFAIMRGTQAGIHRTSNRTIEFFGQHSLLRQIEGRPFALDAVATIEGLNNFRQDYTGAIGAIVSHAFADRAAIYAEPIYVGNSSVRTVTAPGEDDYTFMVGLGARIRFGRSTYVVGEWTPRTGGFRPGESQKAFAIEKRAGGHVFQLNFSNSFGTTLGQVANGGFSNDDWFIGFNISRKFFH